MTEIELTDAQRRALAAEPGKPFAVVDPATQQRYVLVAQEQYERVRPLFEQSGGADTPIATARVPAGILRSQQAFWRDLPQLLQDRSNHGRWVCYHGEERIGIARTEVELIRECLRRGLRDDTYDLHVIEPAANAPWQPEEIEPGGHEVDDDGDSEPSSSAGEQP
jgi:hypothetical protein